MRFLTALLLLLLLAVAAAADALPPPAAASSTGNDVQLPVDSTAELTGPWRIGLAGEGGFEFFFSFRNALLSPDDQRRRESERERLFPRSWSRFRFVRRCVGDQF